MIFNFGALYRYQPSGAIDKCGSQAAKLSKKCPLASVQRLSYTAGSVHSDWSANKEEPGVNPGLTRNREQAIGLTDAQASRELLGWAPSR